VITPPLATCLPPTRAQRAARTSSLVASLQGCPDAAQQEAVLEELVLVNRGVAESVALRYRNRGIATEDLFQVAYVGLICAARRFDPTRADDFLTYAVPTIRGELQRYFRDRGWTVRPPRRIQELQGSISRTSAELVQRLGREPTADELCAELGIPDEDYEEAMAAFGCFQPVSLDQVSGRRDDETIGETVAEHQSLDPAEARTMLQPVLRQLSPRDRRIVQLRYFEDRSQSEIGQTLGVTQAQVSRLLYRILRDLRRYLDTEVRYAS